MLFILFALLAAPILRRRIGTEPTRIVVVQTAKIGDFVCTTPLLCGLRQGFPNARITLIASRPAAALAAVQPFIDAVIEVPPGTTRGIAGKLRWVATLRRLKFDLAICCNGGVAWPGILALAGIPVRIGLTPNFGGRSTRLAQRLWTQRAIHDGNQLIATTYAQMLRLAGWSGPLPDKQVSPAEGAKIRVGALFVRDKGPTSGKYIGVAISSGNKLKELGTPLLIAVCRELLVRRPDASLVFLGTSDDRETAEAIAGEMTNAQRHRLLDTCGQLALPDVPELIDRLDVFVGVDSGLTYIADALKIPLVSIAGPCNMRETRPTSASSVVMQVNLPCSPCAHIFRAPYTCRLGTRACIKTITAEEIVAAIIPLCASQRPNRTE